MDRKDDRYYIVTDPQWIVKGYRGQEKVEYPAVTVWNLLGYCLFLKQCNFTIRIEKKGN